MKQVKIKLPAKVNGVYHIKLGNYKDIQFTNIIKAQAFCNKTGKSLTEILAVINFYHLRMYEKYRVNWQYFDTNRQQGRRLKLDLNKSIQNSLTMQSELIEFVYTHTRSIESLNMTWINLEKIINSMKEINEVILNLHIKKSNYAEVTYHDYFDLFFDILLLDLKLYPEKSVETMIKNMLNEKKNE